MQRLVNTYISALRMDSKPLVGSEEVAIFGDICLAMILTPGGRQWWSIIGPYFTIHDQMNERIENEGDSFSSWVDMIPFAKPELAWQKARKDVNIGAKAIQTITISK